MEKIKNLETFGVMLDCSRNAVMKPETVKEYIDLISDLGYNSIMLYTEDTYEVDNQPYFGHNRGRYTKDELKDLDAYANSKGVELIPCIQTLAHLDAIFHWSVYQSMRDCADILLCEDERTYKLIEDMFSSLSQCLTTKTINIGMDEAHMLGRGRYFDRHGTKDRFDILLNHLAKVSEIAKKYDYKLLMWGDMFFRLISNGNYESGNIEVPQKVKDLIPDNVELVYWDYYSKDKANYDSKIAAHAALKDNIWFAGGLWTWSGFAPHNSFSIPATKAAFDSCFEHDIKNIFVTMWGDNGAECSKFSVLPSLFYASELAKGNSDMELIKTRFADKYGIGFDEFMLLDLPLTPNGNENIINSDKYLFYNDCFMGLFDKVVTPGDCENFGKMAQKLGEVKANKYSYLFKTLEALCKVLEKKADLGIRTRNAYMDGDKEALKSIITDYDKTVSLIEDFYTAYEEQWMRENRPQGFDVQDIRIGGLIRRIEHSKKRIIQFIDGEISCLEELEEQPLDIKNRGNCSHLEFNSWRDTATANII